MANININKLPKLDARLKELFVYLAQQDIFNTQMPRICESKNPEYAYILRSNEKSLFGVDYYIYTGLDITGTAIADKLSEKDCGHPMNVVITGNDCDE